MITSVLGRRHHILFCYMDSIILVLPMIIGKGPCGEKIGYYELVEEQKVPDDMGTQTFVRWLIKEDDGAKAFAMRLFTIKPGGHINQHHHPWEHEIFVLEGVGEIRIGSRVYRVSQGFFIYVPPNVEHEYWNKGDKDLKFLCMIPLKPTVNSDEKIEC